MEKFCFVEDQIGDIEFIVASKYCKDETKYCIEFYVKNNKKPIEIFEGISKQEMKRQMVRIYAILHRYGKFVSNRENIIINIENAIDVCIKQKSGIVKKYYIEAILSNAEVFVSPFMSYEECKRLESYHQCAKYHEQKKELIDQINER